jgi:hypothetical protein
MMLQYKRLLVVEELEVDKYGNQINLIYLPSNLITINPIKDK